MATEQLYFNSEELDLIIRASYQTKAPDWKKFVVSSAVEKSKQILKEDPK